MERDEHTHNLGLRKAIAQLQLLARDLESKYASKVSSYESSWNGSHELQFEIKYLRASVKGKIWVTANKAIIEYTLPLLLKKAGRLISKKIVRRFERYFPFNHRRVAV